MALTLELVRELMLGLRLSNSDLMLGLAESMELV